MEPVSVAASATQLGSALFEIAEKIWAFIQSTKQVDHSILALESLGRGLAQVLELLGKSLRNLSLDSITDSHLFISISDSVESCNATILELKTRLDSVRSSQKTAVAQAWKAYRLGLQQADIDRILTRMRTHSINLQLALQMVNVYMAASIPGAVNADHAVRFDRLEKMVTSLSLCLTSNGKLEKENFIDRSLREVIVDQNTARLYHSAASVVSDSAARSSTASFSMTEQVSKDRDEVAFEMFEYHSESINGVASSVRGDPLSEKQQYDIKKWLHRSPSHFQRQTTEANEDLDEESDDELDIQVTQSLLGKGDRSFAQGDFTKAKEYLELGIERAKFLSLSRTKDFELFKAQLQRGYCCARLGSFAEAELNLLPLIEPLDLGQNDRILRCHTLHTLAEVQLRLQKLDSALAQCRLALKAKQKLKSSRISDIEYQKSLRLLALILWAKGEKIEAEVHSELLGPSLKISTTQFDAALSWEMSTQITPIPLLVVESKEKVLAEPPWQTQSEAQLKVDLDVQKRPSIASRDEHSSINSGRETNDGISVVSAATRLLGTDSQSSEIADYIIQQHKFLNRGRANKGLVWAVKNGNIQVLDRMLEVSGIDVNTRRTGSFHQHATPLMMAATNGSLNVCQRLLEKGASVKLSFNGQSVLDKAIENDHLDVAKLLLAHGAGTGSQAGQISSPLLQAVRNGNKEMCELLARHGVDIDEKALSRFIDRPTAFMQAAKDGSVSLVEWFLHAGAMVDGPRPSAATPLTYAAKGGHANVCRLLLDHGANMWSIPRKGESAYDVAANAAVRHLLISRSPGEWVRN